MKLKLAVLTLCICLFNCKEEQQKVTFDDYRYSQQSILNCENTDTALFQEALLSFEDDILKYYTPDQAVYSRAYSLFVSQAIANKIDYSKMVSEHSKTILEALKQDQNLWTTNPDGSKVNFNHPIFECIGKNIKDEPLRKTFNALIQTNSMSMRMFGGQLRRKTFDMKDDKYLATYVALDLFYGKFYETDLSLKSANAEQAKKPEEHSSHDDHNH
ncbi:hypothetical protein [uncultured Psychroserpens sp.]|uniref:hypothetical protein n=1 Tax=uncultured Psychroserpens sp. TaxID=255436 RepID=UPI0026394C1E|nr:hypothetical protein [uncultured Psychroserpens sp.]